MMFPRSKTGPAMLAPLQINKKSQQTARNIVWNWYNLEFVKTKKMVKWNFFHKLGPKLCTPPDFWKAKPEEPEVMTHG